MFVGSVSCYVGDEKFSYEWKVPRIGYTIKDEKVDISDVQPVFHNDMFCGINIFYDFDASHVNGYWLDPYSSRGEFFYSDVPLREAQFEIDETNIYDLAFELNSSFYDQIELIEKIG